MAQGTQQARNTQLERRNQGGLDRGFTRWDPFSLMNNFRSEMERMFEDFGFGGLSFPRQAGPQGTGFDWTPQTEVFKRDDQLVVRADLPGLSKDDIDVNIENDRITIKGERKSEHEENKQGVFRSERSYGSFFRAIPLPEGTDAEQAKANFKDVVLEVTMPVTEERTGARKLQIE